MKATVRWVKDVMFLGESGSGHTVVMDGPEASGGHNLGLRPMEMLLIGTGGCSSFDVVSILRKARQDITDCEVDMQATRADAVPAVFESIHMHFKVSGRNLSEKQVERAVALSADKYCSASIMLSSAGVKISHTFEIIES
ncbi:OsmC family protein [Pseudohongiella spirulinae]|uniref:OsmC-like protein n=1 Tax=Pseudohongiella spirulinae TaxID=1249552 RepID=A0A0S2KH16_9GAMM|nr:OsmC family protein [Pseudohongiella spirulinae]ALO47332.1 OsmC-like protein [Pseudohongiella spirulinae]